LETWEAIVSFYTGYCVMDGLLSSPWDQYLPQNTPDTAYSDLAQQMQYQPLNVQRLLDAGAIRITDPAGKADNPEGWSLVTRYNDVQPSSVTPNWQNRTSAYDQALSVLNQPGPLYDGKYRQILWSARELGLRPEDVFMQQPATPPGLLGGR
jgi:hypothetical protein